MCTATSMAPRVVHREQSSSGFKLGKSAPTAHRTMTETAGKAARLSADPGVEVLLLESGPHYRPGEWPPELTHAYRIIKETHDWGFTAQAGASPRGVHVPRGQVVGGSSVTNATIALRGLPEHYDDWAQFVPGLDWQAMLPWLTDHYGNAGSVTHEMGREARAAVDAARETFAPLFVREGINEPQPIASLPGVMQHTRQSLREEVRHLADLGVRSIILFGVPASKDPQGSEAWNPNGIAQLALADLAGDAGDRMVIMSDLCVDEYTDHGHCGILDGPSGNPLTSVDNDATLEIYGKIAVAQANAGAQVVAPSGMMDGQVGVIRTALDEAGFIDTVKGQRVVEGIAGNRPEIGMHAHQASEPGVLKLLLAPEAGECCALSREHLLAQRGHGVDVEQRAIRVEYEGLHRAGCHDLLQAIDNSGL